MSDYGIEGVTAETIASVQKALSTSGFNAGLGLVGYDLSKWVSLVPVETPFRNSCAREQSPDGNKQTVWRALLNVNNQQPNPAVGFDFAGTLAVLDEQDFQQPYQPMSIAGRVTEDAVALALGYADAAAIARVNTLNQLMIGEDIKLIGAQAFALATPGTASLTTAGTGGSIASSTSVKVQVSARTANNYYYGGNGIASSAATVTTGTAGNTNTVTATVAAVKGAAAYDWYVGTGSSVFYYTTTTVNKVVITSVPTAAQAVPTTLPQISSVAPAATPPTADGTAGANDTNGLLPSLAGDYSSSTGGLVTPGTGTSSGASFTSLDAASLTANGASITQLDTLLQNIYNTALLSPTALMMNSVHASDLSTDILGTNLAVTYLTPDNASERSDVVGSGWVGTYINKAAGGKRVAIEVHPHLPPGTIIARNDVVSYPNSNISNVCAVRTLRDYYTYDYATNYNPGVANGGPRQDFEVRTVEAFVNRAPVTMGVLYNVANSSTP